MTQRETIMKTIMILKWIIFCLFIFGIVTCSTSTGRSSIKIAVKDAWIEDEIDIDLDGYNSAANIYFEVSSNRNANLVAAIYYRISGNTDDPTYYLYKQLESFSLDGTDLYYGSVGNEGEELDGCYDFLIQIFLESNLDDAKAEISADNNSAIAGICFEEHTQDQTVEIELENPLFTPIDITVTNYETKTANPGEKISFFLNGNPGTVNITAETYGKTNTGTKIGLKMVWDFNLDLTGLSTITRELSLPQDYFFIYMTNNSSVNLTPFYVNYGRAEETIDYILFPGDNTKYSTGYYQAFTNTEIRAYVEGTSSYIYWSEQSRPFIPWTNNQSVDLIYSDGQMATASEKKFDEDMKNELAPIYSKPTKRRLYKANLEIEPIFGKAEN